MHKSARILRVVLLVQGHRNSDKPSLNLDIQFSALNILCGSFVTVPFIRYLY